MTAHPESYGHWDHDQISALLHERDALRELLKEARQDVDATPGLRSHELRRRIDAALAGGKA